MKIDKNNYEEYAMDFLEGTLSEEAQAAFVLFLEQHPEIQDELVGADEAILKPETEHFTNKKSLKKELPCSEDELDEKLIAFLEGDLSQSEAMTVNGWIEDYAEVSRRMKLFKLTQLNSSGSASMEKGALKMDLDGISKEDSLMIAQLEGDLSASASHELNELLKDDSSLAFSNKLYQSTRLSADSIVYPNKSELKRGLVIPLWKRAMQYGSVAASILLLVFVMRTDEQIGLSIKEGSNEFTFNRAVAALQTETDQTNTFEVQEAIGSKTNPTSNQPVKENRPVPTRLNKKEFGANQLASYAENKSPQFNRQDAGGKVEWSHTETALAKTITNAKHYDSPWNFVEDKAKTALWGKGEYPEENYSTALANKALNKVKERAGIEFDKPEEESQEEEKKKGWLFKFRNFKIERVVN